MLSPTSPVSEADSWKVEESIVKPNATSTDSEEQARWSAELSSRPVSEKAEQNLLLEEHHAFEVQLDDKIIIRECIF